MVAHEIKPTSSQKLDGLDLNSDTIESIKENLLFVNNKSTNYKSLFFLSLRTLFIFNNPSKFFLNQSNLTSKQKTQRFFMKK